MPGATSEPMDMECVWEVAVNGIPWSIDIQRGTPDSFTMGFCLLDAHEDCSDCDSSSLPLLLVCAVSPKVSRGTHCLSMWRTSRSARWNAFLHPCVEQRYEASGLWFNSWRLRCSALVKTCNGVSLFDPRGVYGCADLSACWVLAGMYTLSLLGLANATGGRCISDGHIRICRRAWTDVVLPAHVGFGSKLFRFW
jgi:hypothetical protein